MGQVFCHALATPSVAALEGLRPTEEWQAYGHKHFPGFVFIVNPFQPGYERYWVKRCLHDYPCKPSRCNLDAHINLAASDNPWEQKQRDAKGKSLMDKLRWATMGFHHNWDTKEYTQEQHTPFPDDLGLLSQYIAATLGFHDYKAEAAIVNYYHQDSTLSGHVDKSEFNMEAPLISISFGLPAIFLLGGTTKDVAPLPVFIHSGDITVMMGVSRLAYHAVPKILPATVRRADPGYQQECQKLEFGIERKKPKDESKPEEQCESGVQCLEIGRISDLGDQSVTDQAGAQVFKADTELSGRYEETSGLSCRACASSVNADKSVCWGTSEHSQSSDMAAVTMDLNCERCNETNMNIANTVCAVNRNIVSTMEDLGWTPYENYLKQCRINMNVRQVFKAGETFPAKDCRVEDKPL